MDALFHEALEVPPERLGVWLDHACAGDEGLRHDLERLLAADRGAAAQLAGAMQDAVRGLHDEGVAGWRIGPYRVLREIGRGGMGAVYLGVRDDDVFHKHVAIKVVKRGMDTDAVLGRFRHERRILAGLEHPFITRVIDGGSTEDGRPYLVMEYVAGLAITDHCRERHLSLEARLHLFQKVCAAVQHAHQNLVLHRDLKPSNILVDASGDPRLLDFGVAKLLDPQEEFTELTGATSLPLTPRYASPEQLRGDAVSTAADVYALGAVLYEMLAGQPAHRDIEGSPAEMARLIGQEQVLAPSVAVRTASGHSGVEPARLLGDLDNVVLKALQPDARDRYASVEQLCEDIRRYLEHRPVLARPLTFRYRLTKTLRRNRGAAAAVALIAATVLAGVAASQLEARRARQRFEDVRALANAVLFDIDERLQRLPGSTEARAEIVRVSLQYLDRLARESAGERTLLLELARGYQKIGDVQGYSFVPNLGQRGAALESHRKALDIAERLATRSPDDAVVLRLLIRGHDRMAILNRAQLRTAAAVEHFQRSAALARQLDADDSENAEVLIELHGHASESEAMAGNTRAAETHARRMLEIAGAWAERTTSDASRSALLGAHWRLSRALQRLGDINGASRSAREAVRLSEALVRKTPTDINRRRDLLNSYEQLGYVLDNPSLPNLEDAPAGVVWHRKALAIAEELARDDPNDRRASSDLSIVHRNICAALAFLDPPAAESSCRAALATLARLADPDENRPQVLAFLGAVLARMRRFEEARITLEEAVRLQAARAAADPFRTDMRQLLVRIHNHLGAVHLEAGDLAAALTRHRQSLQIAESLIGARVEDPGLHRDLADTYERMASVHASQGGNRRLATIARAAHWREARMWFEKSQAIWTDLAARGASREFDARRRDRAVESVARCSAALASIESSPTAGAVRAKSAAARSTRR